MRVMSLDVGERRIGVALSDPLGIIATPLTTITVEDFDSSVVEIESLVSDNDVAQIIVGLPLSMSGARGPQARSVARFVKLLEAKTVVPVSMVDERLSSVQAERMLQDAGKSPSRNKGLIDSTAAAIILQSYLDYASPSTSD